MSSEHSWPGRRQTPMANIVPSAASAGAQPPPSQISVNGGVGPSSGTPQAVPPPQGQGTGSAGSGGHVKKARSAYNDKAMAEIRNSLRPFEDQHPPSGVGGHHHSLTAGPATSGVFLGAAAAGGGGGVPVLGGATSIHLVNGTLPTGSGGSNLQPPARPSSSLANLSYHECIQALVNLGFDEVSKLKKQFLHFLFI